jgi:acyl carrier protein
LGIEKVGVSDNFFELGGDSVSALKMTAATKETLKWNVPLVSLYEAPTIEQLVEKLGGPKGEEASLRDSGDRGRARVDRMTRRRKQRRESRPPGQQP